MRKLTILATTVLTLGMVSASAGTTEPARYDLRSGEGMPDRLVLRHCQNAEDTLGKLIMVDYRPADGVVVYRCRKPSAY